MTQLLADASNMSMHMNGSAWPQWDAWRVSSGAIFVAVVGIVGLAWSWRRLQLRQRGALVVALVALIALLSSDVQTLSMTSYRAHMMEHLLVLFVIAPLVACSIRVRVSRPVATMGFLAFTVLIPLYHLTPLGGWVMNDGGGHVVELASFMVVGVWFWAPVYAANQVLNDRQRVVYAMLALPVVATTGVVLWSSTASSLSDTGMRMAMITVIDIHHGGEIMMLWGTLLMLVHVGVNVARSMWHTRAERIPVGLRYVTQ